MITTKKDLKETLLYERLRYGSIPKLWYVYSLFGFNEKSIIWRYQRKLRIWEYHLNRHHRIRAKISQLTTCKLGRKLSFSISPNIFDRGLKIMHIGSIIINSHSIVGENCVIHVNTAMVSTNGDEKAPRLGNDCMLGIGAILVGNIELGNEVVVGAGAVVTKSFLQNHITIGGIPAKIISTNAIL